jgi:hypothetical protein
MTLAREIRESLADPVALVAALGLADRRVRQAGGCVIRCVAPGHDDRTPSLSVRLAPDGTIWCRCHGCGWRGDALSLVAVTHRLDVRRDWREVFRRGAELAGRYDLLPAIGRPGERRHTRRPETEPPRRIIPPAHETEYPPPHEVAELLAATGRVTDDVDVRSMLERRGLDAERVDDLGLARVLPTSVRLPRWARLGGRPWPENGYRLVLPVVDSSGQVRSVRAWRITDGDTPKRTAPRGHRVGGLVLACPAARAMLAGERDGLPSQLRIIVAEGEPDFLTWASRFSDADENAPVVIALTGSGSWSPELAARIPDGARVAIRTDPDKAGDDYAATIARALASRCILRRPRVSEAA